MRTKKTMIFSFTSLIFLIAISSLFIANTSGNIASEDNFTWENADLIDSIIYFKSEGIDLGIPEEYVIYEYDGLNGINALIPQDMYDYLETADFVESISENADIHGEPCLDILDWGTDEINAERVWGHYEDAIDIAPWHYTGNGVRVAILGSGVDTTHPDLDDNYQGGYDFVENDNTPDDDHGHGTRCAGVIVAEDNNFGAIGVAPLADFYAIKVFDANYDSTTARLTAGINWAVNNNIDVLSMSFGTSSDITSALNAAYNKGVVLVASSGNEDENSIHYPASVSNVLSVGACTLTGQRATGPTWGSNYGDGLGLVAPGVSIYTTDRNGQYTFGTGTSMSAPMVAGVIALMLQINPDLTPAQVRWILAVTATDVGEPGYDIYTGFGMVDALAACAPSLLSDLPTKVTGMKTTSSGTSYISLSWDANMDFDLDHYNVYRNGVLVGDTTNTHYTVNGLASGTWYGFQVAAVDLYENVGPKSDLIYGATLSHPKIYVSDVRMSLKGGFFFSKAINMYVTVRDDQNNLESGVLVSVSLRLNTGATLRFSGTTNSQGVASIQYLNLRLFRSGTYTCTVTSLSKSGFDYDSSLNLETFESIRI